MVIVRQHSLYFHICPNDDQNSPWIFSDRQHTWSEDYWRNIMIYYALFMQAKKE